MCQELAAREGLPPMEFEQLCRSAQLEKAVLRELADHAHKCTCTHTHIHL